MIDNHIAQKEVSRKLTRLYVVALSAVAIFSIISQILIQLSIFQQQNDARVVNIAGRQRMLSQKLCKTVILVVNPSIHMADAEYYAQDMEEIINLWKKCHYGLKNGVLELDSKIIVQNSPSTDSMFTLIEPVFDVIYRHANLISTELENPTAFKNSVIQKAQIKILQNERQFLKLMDKIVFQYDKEAKKRVEKLKMVEFVIFCLTLLILALEGLFIFKPTYAQINKSIDSLETTNANLEKANLELYDLNQSLEITKNELVTTTEEKYKLQIKEDKIRSASLLEGQEDERKRLSKDLHDGIGQMLTGIKLITERINLDDNSPEKNKKILSDLKQLVTDTIAETRIISFNLMPTVLNDFGIVSALKILLEQAQKNTVSRITFSHNDFNERLSSNYEISIYRIVQEAINNILKHAVANEIKVELQLRGSEIWLEIWDNGKGFDTKKNKNILNKNGIANMRSRAELVNGAFKISSSPKKGTKINVTISL